MYLYLEVEPNSDFFNFRGEAPKADVMSFARVQSRRGLKTYMASKQAHDLQTKNINGSSLRARNAILAGED